MSNIYVCCQFYDFKKPDRDVVFLGKAIKKARSLLNPAYINNLYLHFIYMVSPLSSGGPVERVLVTTVNGVAVSPSLPLIISFSRLASLTNILLWLTLTIGTVTFSSSTRMAGLYSGQRANSTATQCSLPSNISLATGVEIGNGVFVNTMPLTQDNGGALLTDRK